MHSNTPPPQSPFDYVLIVGHGRSGTNWLLDLLDASPLTHGRNEPNEIEGAPLASLPSPWVKQAHLPELDQQWDDAAMWAANHMGYRDHHAPWPKVYHHALATALHLPRALVRPRIRQAVASISPGLRALEWTLPWWAGSQEKMASALPILKFTQVPGWACWVLENRPRVGVIHIVRHPGGFLNSWRNRYLTTHDRDRVAQENLQRLQLIADVDPGWADRFGDLNRMSIEESELWFWRYAAETIHETGDGQPQYLLVNYEKLAAAPLAMAERVFSFCGLPWDQSVAARIGETTEESKSIATAWRDRLAPDDIAIIDAVLEGSFMTAWWDS